MRLIRIVGAALLMISAAAAQSPPDNLLLAPELVGSSAYTVRDFSPEIAASVGKPATVGSMDVLRASISARYVRDGYITPIVTIPAEDVGSATPRLYIYEARLVDVVVRGNPGPYRGRIAATLRGLKTRPLRKELLKQTLLRISELPGITARAIFEPQAGMPNEYVVVVDIRYQPVSAEFDANNGGTSQLGNALYAGALTFNGVLGAGEQVQVRAATSSMFDRYQFADARVAETVWGTELYLEAAHSEAVPDPDIHFADATATAGVNRRLARLGAGELKLVAWLHADDNDIHDVHKIHLTNDRIRSAAVGLAFSEPESPSALSMYSTIVHGSSSFGATTQDPIDSQVQVAFTKYLVGFAQSVGFGSLWRMRINLDTQATSDVLPIVERFAFGGLGLGEAFDPASLVGDSGAAASLELGRALALKMNSLLSATAFAKADYGVAWSNASYLPRRDDAASFSLGVLGRWPHTTATVQLSTPMIQPLYAPPASTVRALASIAFTF